jgi:MFS family permease
MRHGRVRGTLPTVNKQAADPKPWKAFLAAWLGWTFDGLDSLLYVLVALPFVTRLMDKATADDEVLFRASLIQAFFLFGWSVGGVVFGRLGDRLGRARTLTLTILVYALFTGASALATEWWHLLIFRFIAALGIGGEWAAGSALVAETLHPRHRAWASAALQSGYMVGIMLAAWTVGLFRHIPDPRWVFLVGITPALATVWIRRSVPEPAEWRAAAGKGPLPSVAELFRPALLRTTLLTLALTSATLTTVWAFITFGPQAVRQMPEVQAWNDPARAGALVMQLTFFWATVNIAGNFAATYLARALGYRRALVLLVLGAGGSMLVGYWTPPTLGNIYWVYGFIAFFSLGLFGFFPLYVPALFPTLVRTLGAGVCYNTGRIVAGVGLIFGGTITAEAGGPAGAIWWIALLYIPTLVVAALMPELPGVPREESTR